MADPVLLWFKRDLRVADHPALARAAALGPVVPVVIVEPEFWQLPDSAPRHFAFFADCVEDLRGQLAEIGLTLCLRVGPAVTVLDQLARVTGARTLISHEETGNGWTYARDRAVAGWAAQAGVHWQELPQSGVVRGLADRDGWAARRNAFLRADPARPGAITAGPVPVSDPLPRDLIGADADCPAPQPGGRSQGIATLDSFLTTRGRTYRKDMSGPLSGAQACSRLSPHLAWGTLSGREAAQAAQARRAALPTQARDGWKGSLKSFQARLAWRDHFMQKLEDAPRIEWECFHSAYAGLRPVPPDATRLSAWARGETGLPFVDACMRSLNATGWLNFRMRSMLTSVATCHLWLDWRAPGLHLARAFTDYEPGIHWSQIQMQSGTTGINTLRIYNPVKQGLDQDPHGAFTRRWVPELAEVPDAHLHRPWTWDGAGRLLGTRYPEPLFDPVAAARAARQALWAVRSGTGFRAEAQQVIRKHASRKDGAGHFVNDRAPRRRTRTRAEPRQLGFDF